MPVTSTNLRGYNDEQGYLIARINVLKTRLSATNRELRKLNGLTQEDPRLFDIRSKDIDLDRAVSSLGLSSDELAPRLASLKRQRADLQKRYNAAISTQGNAAAARLESIIGSFANQLGEGDLFQSTKGGLYAASFADKTGAHHQLMVFAFRMGYAKIIEEYYGLKLPLVIDSPRGHELDATNGRKITNLLHNEFPDHQVIVASIYEDGFEEAEQRIELLDRIEERSEPIKNGSDSWAYEEYI